MSKRLEQDETPRPKCSLVCPGAPHHVFASGAARFTVSPFLVLINGSSSSEHSISSHRKPTSSAIQGTTGQVRSARARKVRSIQFSRSWPRAYTVERVIYLDALGRRAVLVAAAVPVPAVAGAAVVGPEGRRYARLQVPGAGRLLVVAGFLKYDGEALGRRRVLHVPLPELGQRPPRLVLQFAAKK